LEKREAISATLVRPNGENVPLELHLGTLTDQERAILLDGCLMNYYKKRNK
jgi:aconitate hydratase